VCVAITGVIIEGARNMIDRFAFLALLVGFVVGVYALVSLWRIRHRQSPRLAYAAIVSVVLAIASSLPAVSKQRGARARYRWG
jgi:hypothetical protein